MCLSSVTETLEPLNHNSLFPPRASGNLYFLFLWTELFQIFHISRIMQNVSFYNWSQVHPCYKLQNFLLFQRWTVFFYLYIAYFPSLFTWQWRHYFYILAIVYRVSMNMKAQVTLWDTDFISFGYMPEMPYLDHMIVLFLSIWAISISVLYCAHLCMKYSLGISNSLEEISSLSHSIVFLYFFALITEEGFNIFLLYSLECCIQMGLSFLSISFRFSSFLSYL